MGSTLIHFDLARGRFRYRRPAPRAAASDGDSPWVPFGHAMGFHTGHIRGARLSSTLTPEQLLSGDWRQVRCGYIQNVDVCGNGQA